MDRENPKSKRGLTKLQSTQPGAPEQRRLVGEGHVRQMWQSHSTSQCLVSGGGRPGKNAASEQARWRKLLFAAAGQCSCLKGELGIHLQGSWGRWGCGGVVGGRQPQPSFPDYPPEVGRRARLPRATHVPIFRTGAAQSKGIRTFQQGHCLIDDPTLHCQSFPSDRPMLKFKSIEPHGGPGNNSQGKVFLQAC